MVMCKVLFWGVFSSLSPGACRVALRQRLCNPRSCPQQHFGSERGSWGCLPSQPLCFHGFMCFHAFTCAFMCVQGQRRRSLLCQAEPLLRTPNPHETGFAGGGGKAALSCWALGWPDSARGCVPAGTAGCGCGDDSSPGGGPGFRPFSAAGAQRAKQTTGCNVAFLRTGRAAVTKWKRQVG